MKWRRNVRDWQRRFAWLPTEINGEVIWLEFYERKFSTADPYGGIVYYDYRVSPLGEGEGRRGKQTRNAATQGSPTPGVAGVASGPLTPAEKNLEHVRRWRAGER